MIAAGILFLVGGVTMIKRENSYWSDGSRKIHKKEAQQNIEYWAEQTRKQFGIKGGRTKKHK